MENQEVSKNLKHDGIEQQKENLEQKIENPKEEDSIVRLSNIDKEISKKEENIKSTQNKINDIRESLALSPSNEVSPSIKTNTELVDKLNQEKFEIEHKNKISEIYQESQNEDTKKFKRNLKISMDDIYNNSKVMLDALYERQQGGLTPLQNGDHFQVLVSRIKNLKSFEEKIDINSITKLTEDIYSLSRLFDDFKVQQTSTVKENLQNLEKLAFGAKSFSATAQESGRKLPIEMEDKQMEEKSKELRLALKKLSEQSDKLWLFAGRLREKIG